MFFFAWSSWKVADLFPCSTNQFYCIRDCILCSVRELYAKRTGLTTNCAVHYHKTVQYIIPRLWVLSSCDVRRTYVHIDCSNLFCGLELTRNLSLAKSVCVHSGIFCDGHTEKINDLRLAMPCYTKLRAFF